PAAVTVQCTSAVPATDFAGGTASDNCGGTPAITFVSDVISGQTCPNHYTITRTYRATDACTNQATCTQTITVNDNTPPTITTQAANQTVQCDGAGNTAQLNAWLASHGGAMAFDACGLGAPGNDNCANAVPLAVPSITNGSTFGATNESPAPPFCGTSITAP